MKKRQVNFDVLKTSKARLSALHSVMNAVFDNRINPEVARTLIYGITSAENL